MTLCFLYHYDPSLFSSQPSKHKPIYIRLRNSQEFSSPSYSPFPNTFRSSQAKFHPTVWSSPHVEGRNPPAQNVTVQRSSQKGCVLHKPTDCTATSLPHLASEGPVTKNFWFLISLSDNVTSLQKE